MTCPRASGVGRKADRAPYGTRSSVRERFDEAIYSFVEMLNTYSRAGMMPVAAYG